ncbi:CGNR zinc finger domain-containing protein [Sphingomonas sp. MMS12-HWE2-04]|uniref:CGNR zinc finger domain-containing protein n=1 Tax=Sphingomonas sp. MMS12-HWE2-04 TaxID=3234199 RepID=UPI0038501DF3
MAQKDISQIRIVGGHPALDFVNTVDARRDRWGPDALASYQDLLHWAERVRVVTAEEAVGLLRLAAVNVDAADQAFQSAIAARELIYRIFLAEAHDTLPGREDVDCLTAFAETAIAARSFTLGSEGYGWRWRPDDLSTISDRLVFSATELLVDRSRRAVRECTGRNCGWLFLDQSKGGRRHWCSEAGCGTRERVRRKRDAQKAR